MAVTQSSVAAIWLSPLQVVPAPTIPAEAEANHEKLQWILLKLRRAHMGGKADEPLKSLAADNLIAPGVIYEDPVATSDSLAELQEYHQVNIASTPLEPLSNTRHSHLREYAGWAQAHMSWAVLDACRIDPATCSATE